MREIREKKLEERLKRGRHMLHMSLNCCLDALVDPA